MTTNPTDHEITKKAEEFCLSACGKYNSAEDLIRCRDRVFESQSECPKKLLDFVAKCRAFAAEPDAVHVIEPCPRCLELEEIIRETDILRKTSSQVITAVSGVKTLQESADEANAALNTIVRHRQEVQLEETRLREHIAVLRKAAGIGQ